MFKFFKFILIGDASSSSVDVFEEFGDNFNTKVWYDDKNGLF